MTQVADILKFVVLKFSSSSRVAAFSVMNLLVPKPKHSPPDRISAFQAPHDSHRG